MYITADDIKHEVSLYYPIDNRNGNKKVGLICAYFVYSFYNVEKDEKIHLKISETPKVKRGCYTMKDIEKVSSGKVKGNLRSKNKLSSNERAPSATSMRPMVLEIFHFKVRNLSNMGIAIL